MDVKSNKRKKPLVFIVSVIIVVFITVGFVLVRFNAEKTIKSGLPEIVNDKIHALLMEANNPESNSDAKLMGLREINYEITNIDKEDGYYVLTLEIDCICKDTSAHEVSQSLLAFDVEQCFDIHEDFYIGKYHCRYFHGASSSYAYEPLVYTYVNGVLVHEPEERDTGKNSGTLKCSACGKRYKEGSDNAKSIKLSSMCENCYANFKWSQDVKDEINNLPVN